MISKTEFISVSQQENKEIEDSAAQNSEKVQSLEESVYECDRSMTEMEVKPATVLIDGRWIYQSSCFLNKLAV